MEPVSHQRVSDVFFVSLDPQRGLKKIVRHLERYVDLDLKLGEATRLLEERFDSLSADDRDILGALMWSYIRGRLKGSTSADAVTRWMSQGESVLPTVETSLETTFSPESLRALVRETRQLVASESATTAGAAAEIQRARDELHQMTAGAVTEIIVPQLMALGLAALYLVVVEGYRVQQPPTPPPPRPTGPNRPD
jgi:hypothetical protein